MKYCKKYLKTYYYIPIFGMNINICFNQEDFKYLSKKYQNYDYDLSGYNGFTLMNHKNGEAIIGIFDNNISTIVHELVHLTLFLLEKRMMNVNDSNGEAMAYISAFLFEEINKRMIKHYKKKR